MSSLMEALERIDNWFRQNRSEYVPLFQPGLTREVIEEKTKNLPFQLPEEVYELYQWHNGTLAGLKWGQADLPVGYWFHPLEKPIELYFESMKLEEEMKEFYENTEGGWEGKFWNTDWFPIFSHGNDTYHVTCGQDSIPVASIWYFYPEFVEPEFHYENLTAMMLTVAECYETEAYYLDEEGFIQEDELKVAQIKNKYNPGQDKSVLEKLKLEMTFEELNDIASDLIRLKDPKAVVNLLKILQTTKKQINLDNKSGLRALVARILGEIGDSRAVVPLVKLLSDKEYLTLYWTIISLGKLKDSRATPSLINLLQGSGQELQKLAIWALGEIRDIRAIDSLKKLTESKDIDISQAANNALLKIE